MTGGRASAQSDSILMGPARFGHLQGILKRNHADQVLEYQSVFGFQNTRRPKKSSRASRRRAYEVRWRESRNSETAVLGITRFPRPHCTTRGMVTAGNMLRQTRRQASESFGTEWDRVRAQDLTSFRLRCQTLIIRFACIEILVLLSNCH